MQYNSEKPWIGHWRQDLCSLHSIDIMAQPIHYVQRSGSSIQVLCAITFFCNTLQRYTEYWKVAPEQTQLAMSTFLCCINSLRLGFMKEVYGYHNFSFVAYI